MRNRLFTLWGALPLMLLWMAAAALAADEPAAPPAEEPAEESEAAAEEEAVFEMRELRVFEEALEGGSFGEIYRLTMGQYARCETEPDDEVKAYPKLRSERPYYGKIVFARDPMDQDAGVTFHFVVDESGDDEPESGDDQPGEPPAEEAQSLLQSLAEALEGRPKRKEPPAPPKAFGTHDRLHFDLNRDLDLTNDPVLGPMKHPPAAAIPRQDAKQKVVFDYLTVELDLGPDLGVRPVRLLPRLVVSEYQEKEYPTMMFASPVARQGEIRIGSRQYKAILGHPHLISGRFDRPMTALYLTSLEPGAQREYWWGSDELGAIRRVDGRFYTTSATPDGDKLTVQPYRGDVGLLKIDAGRRDLEEVSMSGSLRSKDAAVAVGTPGASSPVMEKVQECELPVGDYMPNLVSIQYGRLRLSISHNYHSDGKPRDSERSRVFAIEIRKDKPYVWDFSNTPQVMFASPAKDQTFQPDDEVQVYAVLTDPVLDIMIRNLDDTTRKVEKSFSLSDGETQSYQTNLSLDPKVTITNSAGEQVAEGTLPFG